MKRKRMLRQLIRGMDNYKSTGVPEEIYKVVISLAQQQYGDAGGVTLATHVNIRDATFTNKELSLYSFKDVKAMLRELKTLPT